MQAFVEIRLDPGPDFGQIGGPSEDTDIVELSSGAEVRATQWAAPLGRWELGDANHTREQMQTLRDFFRARRGRLVGFRYKDWGDYEAVAEPLAPDGSPTVRLRKTYSSGGIDQVREIKKPVSGTVALERGGSAYTPASIDTTTGVVTLAVDASASISDVTAASPAVVTAAGHGYSTGDVIYITGTGLSEIDDQAWTISVIDTDTFSLDGSDTGGTGGSNIGTAEKYVQPSESLTWSGEFDVPVRFDADEFRVRVERHDDADAVFFLSSLPVKELRL